MNVKNVTTENGKATIQIEIEAAEFENALNKAYGKQKSKISLPGWRKGKVPRAMVEKMYGAEVFYEDAVNELYFDIYTAAVTDQKLNAVSAPIVEELNRQEDRSVALTVSVELYPEVTLGEYKGLEVEKAEATVEDAEVEAEIDRMAQTSARVSVADRAAQMGDIAVIDFEGFVDGTAFDGGKGENYELKLGSNSFIPGFEDQLVGVSAGESKDVVVTFPEDYNAKELAGKEATFKCLVHEVKESIVPEKDDEFAKDVSEFDTLEELKADTRKNLLESRTAQIEETFKNACVAKAIENMQVQIPNAMIDNQLSQEMENMRMQATQNGFTLEQYAGMFGGMDKLRELFRPSAENSVKAQLLAAAVVKAENIEVTAEEIEAEYNSLAAQYSMEVADVKSRLEEEVLRNDLAAKKAFAVISDSAVAVAPKAEEAPAAE